MQHFVLRFAAFSLAFCRSQHCVLLELALRFVGVSTAFCRRQHCVLQELALIFDANSPKSGKKYGLFNEISLCLRLLVVLYFYQNKRPRELNICERMGGWWLKWSNFMLNSMLKTLHAWAQRVVLFLNTVRVEINRDIQ